MPVLSNPDFVETLRKYKFLKPAQLDEVANTLQGRFPESQALAMELVKRGWLTAFQGKQLLLGSGANLIFGPYVLLERLGEGGSGQVFKARHQGMNRIVALKVLRKDLMADPEAVGRFFREVEVISQLAHPAIVHAYDAGMVGSIYFLSMEYVEGTDLDRLVKEKGRLPVAQACDCIRQAALGLQHAHERGLVHRDIKPSNLLLTQAPGAPASAPGVVKILDFGLARLQQPLAGSKTGNLTVLAGNSVMQGTPDFLAPEQALNFHKADVRADIYSLGCSFFFLLTGQAPFAGGTLTQKLLKHQQAATQPITEIRQDLPADLPPILNRMLAKQPQERYQTPGEVAEALAALKMSASTGGRMTAVAQARLTQGQVWLQSGMSRRRVVVAAGSLGVVLVFLLGFLLLRSSDPASTPAGASVAAVPTEPARRTVFVFNGTDQFITLPANLFRSMPSLTVEAWFKTASGGVIFGYQNAVYPSPAGQHVPVLYVGNDGLLRGQFWNSGVAPIASTVKVNDDRWHHACLVADGEQNLQTLYLDGHPIGTRPGALNHLEMANNQIGIGFGSGGWPGCPGWYGFAGTIAEVRIWHKARAQMYIRQRMDQVLAGNESGLECYFPMDEATGNVIRDRSTHGRQGELGGGDPMRRPSRQSVLPFMHPPVPKENPPSAKEQK